MNFFNFVELSHFLIDNYVQEDSIVLDCTSGNGFDSLYLCNHLQGKGFLFSFDVQELAIQRTKKLLEEKCCYTNYKLIQECHSRINEYVKAKVDFAIYNLGYLPKSHTNIKTESETTLISLKKVAEMLNKRGIVVLVAYTGQDKCKERNQIYNFLKEFNPDEFSIMNVNLINVNKYPPEVFIIQKNA